MTEDNTRGMRRTEISCGGCGGHLGHVFEGESLTPTNERHCVNSVSVKFLKGTPPAVEEAATAKAATAKAAAAKAATAKAAAAQIHYVLGTPLADPTSEAAAGQELAIFASGCYWGAEKQWWRLPGVCSTAAGFIEGTEAVRVSFDPTIVSFSDLLRWFWQSHDPTQVDGQGNDRGPEYRSAVYFSGEEQRAVIRVSRAAYQRALFEAGGKRAIATELRPLTDATQFHLAEPSHQQYLARPGARLYCSTRPLNVQQQPWRTN